MSWPFHRIWQGVPLGFDRNSNPIDYTADDDGSGNAPVLVFGPPGSRKTVGLIATALLDEPGERSFIVIDPKGEIAAITANYRRKVCGADNVKIINPYGVLVKERPDLKSDGWNPLGDLEPAAQGYGDECAAKGDALIKPNSNDSQPIFANSARSAFTAGINFEVRDARAQIPPLPPSLANVRAMLTLETEELVKIIKKMIATGDADIVSRVRKFFNDNREIQSIKSNIETDTSWMTRPMRDDMCVSGGVDFRDCSMRPTTIYIIIPTSELNNKASYLRLAMSSALRALYRHDAVVPTTLIAEEAFVIGHLTELEQAASILRGYNSRLIIVFQSLQQIKKLYPDTWGLFTAGAVLGFRPADLETAKWLVERAGKQIVPVFGATEPKPGEVMPVGGWTQQLRDRIPLDKMFGMPQGCALVWKPHDEAPRISYVKGYFEIPELNARADANPYYKGRPASSARAPGRKVTAAILAVVAVMIGGAWLFNTTTTGVARSWSPGVVSSPGGASPDDHHQKQTPQPPSPHRPKRP